MFKTILSEEELLLFHAKFRRYHQLHLALPRQALRHPADCRLSSQQARFRMWISFTSEIGFALRSEFLAYSVFTQNFGRHFLYLARLSGFLFDY